MTTHHPSHGTKIRGKHTIPVRTIDLTEERQDALLLSFSCF